jgi:hypothetical protein
MEIKKGQKLEVLWMLGAAPGKKRVWWGAHVRNTHVLPAVSEPRSATIRYDALHGYGAADYKVRFISNTILESAERGKQPVRHFWRWVAEQEPDKGRSTGDSTSKSAAETNRGGENDAGPADREITCSSSAADKNAHIDLRRRIRLLEGQMHELRKDKRANTSVAGGRCGRTLLFARHKLGTELYKPLSGTGSSLSKYRDAHTVSQSFLSVTVDCELAEFKDLCTLATSQAEKGVRVHPSVSRATSFHAPSSYSILFETYADLCKVLGVLCIDDVAETIIKTKVDKRENAPISVRVIGSLKQARSPTDGCMIMGVGNSISKVEDYQSPLPVLFRKSQVWDPVEGSFADPLVTATLTPSEIQEALGGDDSGSHSTTELLDSDTSGAQFELTWTRTSTVPERLFEVGNGDSIIGYLTVSVPYVLFRGLPFCAEVVRACNENFIKSATK